LIPPYLTAADLSSRHARPQEISREKTPLVRSTTIAAAAVAK